MIGQTLGQHPCASRGVRMPAITPRPLWRQGPTTPAKWEFFVRVVRRWWWRRPKPGRLGQLTIRRGWVLGAGKGPLTALVRGLEWCVEPEVTPNAHRLVVRKVKAVGSPAIVGDLIRVLVVVRPRVRQQPAAAASVSGGRATPSPEPIMNPVVAQHPHAASPRTIRRTISRV